MIRVLCIATIVVCSLSSRGLAQNWTPPEKPDPSKILQEARADTQAKRYEDALAKHVWYHNNALEIQPSQYGVRLSFALSYWQKLNEQYPPSLKKFQEIRDQAMKDVLEGKNVRHAFHDLASLNEKLGEERITRKTFEALHLKSPEDAKLVFGLAQPVLIRAKLYRLVGSYVNPGKDFAEMSRNYKASKEYEAKRGARGVVGRESFAERKFTNSVTILVAILVVNDRKSEAEKVAEKARKIWDDETFSAQIDDALEGVVPTPWP